MEEDLARFLAPAGTSSGGEVVAEEGRATNCAKRPGNPTVSASGDEPGYVSLSQSYQLYKLTENKPVLSGEV